MKTPPVKHTVTSHTGPLFNDYSENNSGCHDLKVYAPAWQLEFQDLHRKFLFFNFRP